MHTNASLDASGMIHDSTDWSDPPAAQMILDPDADRADWHHARADGIGSSDILTVLDMNGWSSRYELYLQKTGQVGPRPSRGRMGWGVRMEPVVAQWFTEDTGLSVRRTGMWRHRRPIAERDGKVGWAMCNPDRFVSDGSGLEIKTVSSRSPDATLWHIDVPDLAEAQAQWCMGVTGLHRWWVAGQPDGQDKPIIHQVVRDDELISDMFAAAGEFLHDHVLPCAPPPVDESEATRRALDAANAELVGPRKQVELGVVGALLVMRRKQLKDRLKTAGAELALIENELKQRLHFADVGLVGGLPRIRYSPRSRTDADGRRLREEFPDVWEQVSRTIRYMELRGVKK